MNIELLQQQLAELPLYECFFISTDELAFSPRVREVCKSECPMYGKTWACPPAVGTVEECQAKCLSYPQALVIATVTEVRDIADIQETLDTRHDHEAITRQAADMVRAQSSDVYVLSTEACALCDHCAYPDAPCRRPEQMHPCVESHAIVVTDLAERHQIDFIGGNIVTWFSIIFFR